MYEIKKVKNGFIINSGGEEEIFTTLDEVLNDILMVYEGRSSMFGGDSFGVVEIHRKLTKKYPEIESA